MLLEAGKTLADVIEIFRDGLDGFPSGVQSAMPKEKEHRRGMHERYKVIIKTKKKRNNKLLCLNLLLIAQFHFQAGGKGCFRFLALLQLLLQILDDIFLVLQLKISWLLLFDLLRAWILLDCLLHS